MKKISFWASTHTQTARILIVIIKLLLALLAYYTGMELYKANLILPANEIYFASLLLMIIIIIIYPDRNYNQTFKKRIYFKQKLCDFILPLCSFAVITVMFNNADITSPNAYAFGHSSIKNPTAKEILTSGKTNESLTRKEKKILKKEFYTQLKKFAAAKLSNDQFRSGESWKNNHGHCNHDGLIDITGFPCMFSFM